MKKLSLILACLSLFGCAYHQNKYGPDITKIRFICGEKSLICAEIYQIYSGRMAMVAVGPTSIGRHAQAYTLINGEKQWISLKYGYIRFWMQDEFRPTEFYTVPQFRRVLKMANTKLSPDL